MIFKYINLSSRKQISELTSSVFTVILYPGV